jgi:hypothetical protein
MQRGTRKHLRVSSQEAAARLACSRGSGGLAGCDRWSHR